jgi:GT2 family glycosyltransferase
MAAQVNDTLLLESRESTPKSWPSVSIVFLVHNRCDELRESLGRMLSSDYDPELLDVIVVDNASTDGSGAMVVSEFPQVRLIVREENVGVSGWNDGFATARGDYVLALDDDCYLEKGGLKQAVAAAEATRADLVSFGIASPFDPDFRFDEIYRTGLLSFWGCAVLMRREVLERLVGYDPDIFVWANELEFMLRFFDNGFRHLHTPEMLAFHMKDPHPRRRWPESIASPAYRFNGRHFAYIAGKLFRPRDAIEALVARLARHLRDALRENPAALKAVPDCLRGFVQGIRRRDPVNRELSRFYRRNFHSFASPWWLSRPLPQLVRQAPRELARTLRRAPRKRSRPPGRREEYYAERSQYYPNAASTLEF